VSVSGRDPREGTRAPAAGVVLAYLQVFRHAYPPGVGRHALVRGVPSSSAGRLPDRLRGSSDVWCVRSPGRVRHADRVGPRVRIPPRPERDVIAEGAAPVAPTGGSGGRGRRRICGGGRRGRVCGGGRGRCRARRRRCRGGWRARRGSPRGRGSRTRRRRASCRRTGCAAACGAAGAATAHSATAHDATAGAARCSGRSRVRDFGRLLRRLTSGRGVGAGGLRRRTRSDLADLVRLRVLRDLGENNPCGRDDERRGCAAGDHDGMPAHGSEHPVLTEIAHL
jgi:hypothetical protein